MLRNPCSDCVAPHKPHIRSWIWSFRRITVQCCVFQVDSQSRYLLRTDAICLTASFLDVTLTVPIVLHFRATIAKMTNLNNPSPPFAPGQHIIPPPRPSSPETSAFRLNHLMLRIKNPEDSLRFYNDCFGLHTIFIFNTGPWTIYYLGPRDVGMLLEESTHIGMRH